MSHGGARLLASQDGYTALEMIITMALTGILSGAIFSSFLVLDRIQTAWQERDQARAVGVLAEQPLLRDVQAYKFLKMVDNGTGGNDLVLQGLSTDGTPVQVTYAVVARPGGSVLNRSVTPCLSGVCQGPVAHGVQKTRFTANCVGTPPNTTITISVRMWLDAITTKSPPQQVEVSPQLQLTSRNLQPCP